MYNFLKDLDSITKDAPTSNPNHGDDTCRVEETKKHVDSPLSRNMRDAVVSLSFLAIFMFIIYIVLVRYKTKYTISGPLSTKKNLLYYSIIVVIVDLFIDLILYM